MQKYQRRLLISGSLITFSLLLVLPQYLTGGVILGEDFLFHYNRFYDAAMQIKTGNFHYFISTYGFQQSGRIVNALYGPLFAYFQGGLVLLAKTWYNYQMISRLVLNLIASFSMYALLRTVHIKARVAVTLSCFYLTTFCIQYWTLRQGFTSWGAAFTPLALIPAFKYAETHELNAIKLACCVSLLLQVHVLSTVFLVLTYLPFFGYGLITSPTRKKDILKLVIAISLFLILTLNVWTVLLAVTSSNNLILPFTNKHMYLYSITERSMYWLFTPIPLALIIIALIYISFKFWHNYSPSLKITTGTFFTFLLLSTSLFPWYFITKYKIKMLEIFQFPFRFFVIPTILACVLCGTILSNQLSKHHFRIIYPILCLLVLIGFIQTMLLLNNRYERWLTHNDPIKDESTFVFDTKSTTKIRNSLYSTNLAELLSLVQKKTPDYLPSYHDNKKGNYDLYEYFIIWPSDYFTKTVSKNKLIITWYGDKKEPISVPVIKYDKTSLVLNNKKLTKHQYELSDIGTPVVMQHAGKNRLVVSYNIGSWFNFVLVITLLTWLICLLYLCYNRFKLTKRYMLTPKIKLPH